MKQPPIRTDSRGIKGQPVKKAVSPHPSIQKPQADGDRVRNELARKKCLPFWWDESVWYL